MVHAFTPRSMLKDPDPDRGMSPLGLPSNFAAEHLAAQPPPFPKFAKQFGLDFILTSDDRVILVEMQSGFGRIGPKTLFPELWNRYRHWYHSCHRESEPHEVFFARVKKICRNKLITWRQFSSLQPRTHFFDGWNDGFRTFVETLDCEFLIFKPVVGSCGHGIKIWRRDEVLQAWGALNVGKARLVQEYVFSKPIVMDSEGLDKRVGCIRHIIAVRCDGHELHVMHLPSYWRVAPVSLMHGKNRESLTANVSRDATPMLVNDDDRERLKPPAVLVVQKLVALAWKTDLIPLGQQEDIHL